MGSEKENGESFKRQKLWSGTAATVTGTGSGLSVRFAPTLFHAADVAGVSTLRKYGGKRSCGARGVAGNVGVLEEARKRCHGDVFFLQGRKQRLHREPCVFTPSAPRAPRPLRPAKHKHPAPTRAAESVPPRGLGDAGEWAR